MGARFCLSALLLAGGLSGCGLADDAKAECRCNKDMDPKFEDRCRDTTFEAERPDAANPFAARLPDCPSGKHLSLLEPTRAEYVLFNIKTTFEGFSPLQYMDQLAEEFLFIPEPVDMDRYREVYRPPEGYNPEQDTLWTRAQELSFARGLLDKSRFQRVEFRRWYESSKDQRTISEDGRDEVFFFPYDLDFIPQPGSADQEVLGIKGRMEVEIHILTAENPVWSLRRWQDFREATAKKTWTEARARFSR